MCLFSSETSIRRTFLESTALKKKTNRTIVCIAVRLSCMWSRDRIPFLFIQSPKCPLLFQALSSSLIYFTSSTFLHDCPKQAMRENSICLQHPSYTENMHSICVVSELVFTCARLKMIKLIFCKHPAQVKITITFSHVHN